MKTFKPYTTDQPFLLPPVLQDWLPENHLAAFISEVVEVALDLTPILAAYETGDGRGQPPYHPALMVKLLLYGYCTGKPSSRQIERATYEEIPYRVLAANQHPDHDTIAAFRQTHLPALAALFAQVLRLCQRAGLVQLGHGALDGTKVLANASKHKAMSYGRMPGAERKLEQEIAALLAEAQRVDAAEDAQYGRGQRGDELPAELARRESRLAKIRAARAELETEAQAEAATAAAEAQAKVAARERQARETGRRPKGRPPKVPDPTQATPAPKAQRNFTDPASRIMKDGATKSYVQAYNAQAAVDGAEQVIVAAAVTQAANDKAQLVPLLTEAATNCGVRPTAASADAGYFSEAAVTDPALAGIDLYVAPDRQKHGDAPAPPAEDGTVLGAMRAKLQTATGHAVYALRKAIVEPVFGQIKGARGFRRFSVRGLGKVQAEWSLICLTHNLLKLFRAGWCPQAA
ncbi:MAG TPA: IS1182 family transposase [Candidatus Methylomirabilis sp.]|nr:IS1182 family transposase [Candidatus Methylomirabilis sp.]